MAQPQGRQIGGDLRSGRDPLDHWLEQERAAGVQGRPAAGPLPDARALPGGWWIVPALALALPVWGLIFWALLGN